MFDFGYLFGLYEYVFDFGGLIGLVYLVFDVYVGVFVGICVCYDGC